MRCYTFLRKVSDIQHHGTTPYVARHGIAFNGHKIPFGADVHYLRFGDHTKVIRDHPLGEKTHKAIFLGYDLLPGGLWSGDYYIDAETIHNADSIHRIRALKVKDVIMPEYFVFPLASGAIKQPEDQRAMFELEDDGVPTSFFDMPEIDELGKFNDDHAHLFGDYSEDEAPDATSGGATPANSSASNSTSKIKDKTSDFYSFNGVVLVRHHLIARQKLFVPDAAGCPIPLKCRTFYVGHCHEVSSRVITHHCNIEI